RGQPGGKRTCMRTLLGVLSDLAKQLAAQRAQRSVELLDGFGIQAADQLPDPTLVLLRHLLEGAPSARREMDDRGAAILGVLLAPHQAVALELVGESGDVAAGHHQALRQRLHPQPFRVPVELRHVVEARERDAEALAQAAPDFGLELRGAGEQPQPQLERGVVVETRPRFVAELLRLVEQGVARVLGGSTHAVTSPPETEMHCPVMAAAPAPQSQRTASATSSGWRMRPCGLTAAKLARA